MLQHAAATMIASLPLFFDADALRLRHDAILLTLLRYFSLSRFRCRFHFRTHADILLPAYSCRFSPPVIFALLRFCRRHYAADMPDAAACADTLFVVYVISAPP